MGGVQRIGHLHSETQHGVSSDWATSNTILQRLAFEVLHGDERSAVLLADIVDRADMWMVQRRCGLGFTLEATERIGIGGEVLRNELERNGTMQPRIFGFVDDAHAAAAELLEDAVVGERLTDQRIGVARHQRRLYARDSHFFPGS